MSATSTFQRTRVGSPFDAARVYDVMREVLAGGAS
jgi:hypothetical protein